MKRPRAATLLATGAAATLLVVTTVGFPARQGAPSRQPASAGGTLFSATGFFHTAFDGRRWWIVTPDGRPFYVNGIDHVTSNPDVDKTTGQCPYCIAIAAQYPSTQAWATATLGRLRAWGFNSLGAWSDATTFGSRMPYTVLLSMASGSDWFAPGFVTNAQSVAATQVAPLANDPNLIGWFTDSELRWGPDWTDQHTLLDSYLTLPPGSPGRAVAERYVHDPEGFLRALATRYFSVTTAAIRAVDPNHMILGVKIIAQLTSREVLEAAAPYVDVFSVDDYTLVPGLASTIQHLWNAYVPVDATLSQFYRYVRKPLVVAEYSFRGAGGTDPNTWPPIYPTYADQTARAAAYKAYVTALHAAPWVVGDFWFEFADEPAGGRVGDGENSDFGVVSTSNVPWATLVDTMAVVHAEAPGGPASPSPNGQGACWAWQRTGVGNQVTCSLRPPPCPYLAGADPNRELWPYCGLSTVRRSD